MRNINMCYDFANSFAPEGNLASFLTSISLKSSCFGWLYWFLRQKIELFAFLEHDISAIRAENTAKKLPVIMFHVKHLN